MRTLVVAACLLFSLPALAATPEAAPAPAAAGARVDWALQADRALRAVKPQLQLSDAQVEQIRPILIHYLPQVRDLFASRVGRGVETGTALITHFRELRETFRRDLDPILNDAQKKEFMVVRQEVDGEIRREFIEARLAWYRRTVGLDDAQIETIRPIVADHFDQQLQILKRHADTPTSDDPARPIVIELQTMQQATDTRLRGVLTPQQFETYVEAETKTSGGGAR